MGSEPLPRKLAAILYADVAGYSRLTGQDEDGTHRQLSASLDLISNTVRGYRGRVVHYAGDAVLADFDTVSDALSCAAAVQRDLAEHNGKLNDDQKVQFRIGINLGEVIVDREDIYGDGVNVAARLEALAEPGGICVSDTVRTAAGNKLPLEFEFMGEQEVKNIAEPVRAYHVRLEPDARLPEPQVSPLRKNRRLKTILATAVVVILVAVIAGVAWWQPWAPGPEPASLEDTAFPLPDRPSIAVLPFDNLSGDSAQEYFADGMADDLITDLSRISGLFVIARNSSFTYKGKPTDARRVARELGVRYVLEGSVRRSGDQVRINAQLIDGKDGGHLWAKRYDGSLSNSFALQDQITRSIVDALAVTLTSNEATRGGPSETSNAAAYDTFLEGWEHYRRSTPEDYATAIELFEKAIAKDPRYARAHAALAATLWNILDTGWRSQMGYSTLDQVFTSINKHLALALERPSALALKVSSQLLLHERHYDESLARAQEAVGLEPGDADAQANLAQVLVRVGQAKVALPVIEHAMRLDPHYPPHYLLILGSARFFNRQYEQAVAALEKAVNRQPEFEWHYLYLAAAYGQLGQIPLASEAQSKFNAIMASRGRFPMTLGGLGKWSKFRKPADLEHLRAGLERAGVPAGTLSEGEKYEALVHETSDGFDVDGAIKIDAAGAKALFDRGATFIDVRSDSGWQGGHIPGARHLSLNTRLNRDSLSRVASVDDELVFYCEGVRCYLSAHASARAISWGFIKVYYFAPGFPSWTAAGYPAEQPKEEQAAGAITEEPSPPLPDKPSIAVLPFTNLSGDAEQEYFADGMADDLITDLSRISELFVIARNSSFTYKGKPTDARRVARELGVRYVLEGSVRRSGDQVRINAQLIDATTGGHLWAERYDGSLEDVFKLQDEVTRKIVAALAINLSDADQSQIANKGTQNTAAYEEFLRGWEHYRRGSPAQYAKAVDRFNKALSLDPEFARAQAAMASIFFRSWREGWHRFMDLQGFEAWRLTKQHLANAMRAPTGLAHQVSAELNLYLGKHGEAIADAENAVTAEPNDADNYAVLALTLIFNGKPNDAMAALAVARRHDPYREWYFAFLQGLSEFGNERFEDAADSFEKAIELNPDLWSEAAGCGCNPFLVLLATYGHLDRQQSANKLRDKILGNTGADIESVLSWWPYKRDKDKDRLAAGLRKAKTTL